MSRSFGVSVNTVKTAYGILEDRRVIEARPSRDIMCAPGFRKWSVSLKPLKTRSPGLWSWERW